MTDRPAPSLSKLKLAIHGVSAPVSCGGTHLPNEPVTFVFKDGSRFSVPRARSSFDQIDGVKPLIERCRPAKFGDKKTTRHDRAVRDALQLNAEGGAFHIDGFDPTASGILETIRGSLAPHDANSIVAELYAVNVYTSGGHFAPHKDTPRGGDMLGTLVVCLSSQFGGGDLVLVHRGVEERYRWGDAIRSQKESNRIHWAAFFGDVDHRIERVDSGARITLAYNLRRPSDAMLESHRPIELEPTIRSAFANVLADANLLADGGVIGYPCSHLYHADSRFQQERLRIDDESASMLKGLDRLVAAAALEAGLPVQFVPHLFEICADERWLLKRFPKDSEARKLGHQVAEDDLERALPILERIQDEPIQWIEPPPSSFSRTWSKNVVKGNQPAAAHLHSCDYCAWGYFGNESSETDFYTHAALHFKLPPFGQGIRRKTVAVAKVASRKPRTRKPRTRKPKSK